MPAFECGPPRDDDELRRYGRIFVDALFPTPPMDPNWFDDVRNRVTGIGETRLVRCDGRLAGGLVGLPMAQWFGGRAVPVSAVTAVAIAPEHRGRGAAKHLLSEHLAELRRTNVPIAALYPATQGLYRSVGYELAGVRMRYRLPLHGIDAVDDGRCAREATDADHGRIVEIYTARARTANGCFDRSEGFWKQRVYLTRGNVVFRYVIECADGIEGYVFLTHAADGDGHQELHVRDAAATTAAAWRAIHAFLSTHRSIAHGAIIHGGVCEPLVALMPEPDTEIVRWRLDWMLRIVDVLGALEARGYPRGIDAAFGLDVRDPLIVSNAGRWRVTVRDGTARVVRDARGGAVDLRVDARGLASLYTGYHSVDDLVALGRADVGERGAEVVRSLFAGPMPAMGDMF